MGPGLVATWGPWDPRSQHVRDLPGQSAEPAVAGVWSDGTLTHLPRAPHPTPFGQGPLPSFSNRTHLTPRCQPLSCTLGTNKTEAHLPSWGS